MGNKATMPDLKVETATITPGESAKVLYKGTIRFYNTSKGYGFIGFDDTDCNDEDDIFYHISGTINGFIPSTGERCQFTIGVSRGKPCALQVNKL